MMKRLRFVVQEATIKNKEVATNGNGLGVEVVLKNSKVKLGEIGMVVDVNKITCH
jgi:hypothetical protein